jgi:predicted Zn-dependent protease
VWDEDRARSVLSGLVARAPAPETEASLAVNRLESTRFAEGEITQSLSEENVALSFRAAHGRRTARMTTDRLGDAARTLAACSELARAQPEDLQLLPLPDPQAPAPFDRYREATANLPPRARAEAIRQMVAEAEGRGLRLAGVYANGESLQSLANTRGLFASHRESQVEFSVTALSPTSSGWAKATDTNAARLDVAALARSAMDKADAGREKKEIEPGTYTAILEPSAVTDLFGFLFFEWGGQAVREQRSFLSERMGEALFGENIHICDDVFDARQGGPPWDGEGVPRQKVVLVERGVAKNLVYSRASAAQAGARATGHGFPLPNEMGEMPANIVMQGGPTRLEDMIAATRRGILVTRFWYVREVDPMSKLLTGMTRDGTFLIEDGRVRHALKDLRFNQGLLEMLRSVSALGPSVRASGEEGFDMVVPPMAVEGFRFAESTGE